MAANVKKTPDMLTLELINKVGLLPVALAMAVVIFTLIEPRFLSWGNFVNVLTQTSFLLILAVAQTFVLITRGFDLSVGNLISMTSVLSSMAMVGVIVNSPGNELVAVWVGVATAVGIGACAGLFNGFVVAFLKVNPFIATLGSMSIALGIALTASNGIPISGLPNELTSMLVQSTLLGVPMPIVVATLVCLISWVILNRTVFGRNLYIIGANPRAAFVAGMRTRFWLMMAYVVASTLVGIGAIMLTARVGTGAPTLGGGLMIQSIVAAVIGGVSLRGGRGGIKNAFLGALTVTVLSNGMNLSRIDGYIQMIVLGTIVILAVAMEMRRSYAR